MLAMCGQAGYFCRLAVALYTTLLVEMRINNVFLVDINISDFRCLSEILSGVLRSMMILKFFIAEYLLKTEYIVSPKHE